MKKTLALIMTIIMIIGVALLPTMAEEPICIPYDTAEENSLLYTVNFNGDSVFENPGFAGGADNTEVGWNWTNDDITVTVDSENPTKAKFEIGTKSNTAWGAKLTGYSLGTDFSYTLKAKITFTSQAEPLAILIDGHHGFIMYPHKTSLRNNGGDLKNHTSCSFNANKISGVQPTAAEPSTIEYALEIDGANQTLAVYVKANDGKWEFMDKTTKDEMTFSGTDLTMYFYGYYLVNETTMSDVELYKGIKLLEYENSLISVDTDDDNNTTPSGDDTSESKSEVTTYSPPKLVTEKNETESSSDILKEESGCKSSVGSAWMLVAFSATGVVLLMRKKKYE